LLNFAIQMAHDAGRVLAEKFGKTIQVTHKGDINIVTEADLAAERLIIDRIGSHYPRHSILSEEAGKVDSIVGTDSEWRWIIDPLDGTTNYSHGYPVFAVSIGLEKAGEIVVGVVYDPMREELFAAEKGGGATLNGRRIQVSNVDDLNRAMLCTGFPYSVREKSNFAHHFTSFIMHSQAVRRDGAAAIDLAYVACGRFDGFWEDGLNPWDAAAGLLLIEEAGGRVSEYDGSKFNLYAPPILASNGLIHEQMMHVLTL
jgi:myo-inositol-1(or 4)-monophosphatase